MQTYKVVSHDIPLGHRWEHYARRIVFDISQWVKDFNAKLAKNAEFKKVGRDVGLYPLTGHITTDMAIEAVKGEQLGQGEETDMLCVSYSETDVIGHKWGTRGAHTDEAYLELDKDLERLFNALDAAWQLYCFPDR